MALRLGIDTGGTYTDAALVDDARGVLASGKVLTRHHDLSRSIREALQRVLSETLRPDLVAVSTTLATNAIVEGHGGAACLVLIGQGPEVLQRGGLNLGLGGQPVAFVAGGHRASGDEAAALDEAGVVTAVSRHAPQVRGFAVSGLFAVRNPQHELRARDLIAAASGLPVTCGHELSAALDAPRRALTALINARLVPLIGELITAVQETLGERGIDAPLMVVKGDGSLVSAALALQRPVETILSGPAASTVGARWCHGQDDAIVVDIGGTTTDVGILRDGWPALDENGAHVAGLPTMVKAINAHTYGLGGDSEVHCANARVHLGPQRAVPLSLLAAEHPQVLERLREQSARGYAHEHDARFALRRRRAASVDGLTYSEREIWRLLADGPLALERLHERVASALPLARLRARGLLALSAFTPSDAAHVLGAHQAWSHEAAELGAALTARCAALRGAARRSAHEFSECVVAALTRQSCEVIIDALLREEGDGSDLAGNPLLARALGERERSLLGLHVRLAQPLVAIGASAAHYYPAVAERLGANLATPRHAEVANAVGAAMSGIVQRASALITLPRDDRYRVHDLTGTADFPNLDAAAEFAITSARDQALAAARAAGAAGAPQCEVQRDDRTVSGPDGHQTFLESRVTVIARGDPL